MDGSLLGFSSAFILIVGVITFFIVRKVLRVALKLAFVGALLLAMLLGAGFWWWTTSSSPSDAPARRLTQVNSSSRSSNR